MENNSALSSSIPYRGVLEKPQILYLIRGSSGSGKSTLASILRDSIQDLNVPDETLEKQKARMKSCDVERLLRDAN